jgi:hypothetical protein
MDQKFIGPLIVVVAVLVFAGFVVWMWSRTETARRKMVFDAQRQLLDKVGSGAELTQFLASAEGKEFIARLSPPPPEIHKPSPAEMMFLMIWFGVVATFVGGGFFAAAALVGKPALIVPGALSATAGIGLLVGLVVTHQLARRWGLSDETLKKAFEAPPAQEPRGR